MFSQIVIFFCVFLVAGISGKSTRIINGVYADIADFPFYTMLKRISDDKLLCGGAIITKKHILTAGHCVLEPFISHVNLKLVVGTSDQSKRQGITYLPDRIYIHPKFTGDLMETNIMRHYDIAVLKTNEMIVFSKYVNIINLPKENIENGDIGILSGWGSTSYPSLNISTTLRKNWMKIMDYERCSERLPIKMRDDQFCAFQEGTGPCTGDSGSPLVNLNHVVGVVSIVRPCATGVPDIYTNVYMHLNFIAIATDRLE